jgi:hypothetical protein
MKDDTGQSILDSSRFMLTLLIRFLIVLLGYAALPFMYKSDSIHYITFKKCLVTMICMTLVRVKKRTMGYER